jgi:hypothetical protein
MLKVIIYYIDNKFSSYFNEMITPEIIIWLLKIQIDQIKNPHLGAKCAMVMLDIVQKHDIKIKY